MDPMESRQVILKFSNDLDYLRLVAGVSRLVCQAIKGKNIQEDFVDAVELAVCEACSNAMVHAPYSAPSAEIVVIFQVLQDRLMIQVRDPGPGFELDHGSLPDFEAHPETGYGIYLIKSMMDEVENLKDEKHHTLVMAKHFLV